MVVYLAILMTQRKSNGKIILTIWYTFKGKEDMYFNSIVQSKIEKNIKVEAISKPYGSSESFVTAALGMRRQIYEIFQWQLGYVGKFRQNGFPF